MSDLSENPAAKIRIHWKNEEFIGKMKEKRRSGGKKVKIHYVLKGIKEKMKCIRSILTEHSKEESKNEAK